MTINVFEGARRIAKLVAGLWIVGVSAFTLFQSNPYITVTYTASSPNGPLVLSDPPCLYGDTVREDFTVKTKKGTEAHATACYLPPKLQHEETSRVEVRDITKLSDDELMALDRQARLRTTLPAGFVLDEELEELQELRLLALRKAIHSFVLSPADESQIESRWWRERWRQILEVALWLVAGLACLWGLTWTIGWIVRGFLGIPRGKDRQE